MSRNEMMKRGWQRWGSADSFVEEKWAGTLYLCPVKDFPNVPDGTEMVSIMGDRVVKGKDRIDMDHRGGILAYGVVTLED